MRLTKAQLRKMINELNGGSHPEGAVDPFDSRGGCAALPAGEERQECWNMAGYKDSNAGVDRRTMLKDDDRTQYIAGWAEAKKRFADYEHSYDYRFEGRLKITKSQLKQIIKEEIEKTLEENALGFNPHDSNTFPPMLRKFVEKHARADLGSINDNVNAALADPDFKDLGIPEEMLTDIIEAYHDKMWGLY